MKSRGRFKAKKKTVRWNLFFISILGVILVTVLSLYRISDRIWPILVKLAISDSQNIVVEVMNQAVQKQVIHVIDLDSLFTTTKDENGLILMIDFNPVTLNKMLQVTNETVQEYLRAIENSDVAFLQAKNITLDKGVFETLGNGRISLIPMGVVTHNALLANLGPKIPVKIHFIGSVTSNVVSKMSSYGINNVLLYSYIKVNVKANVMLPLSLEEVSIETEVPISIKMIQGKVPNYYQNGYHNNSPLLSAPFEE